MAGRLFIAAATLALATACSSTGSDPDLSETPDPVQTPDGQTGPQRNLLMSDLSYGSPGNGRAINETFELAVTTFRVAPDPDGSTGSNGGVLGLVRGSESAEGFSDGNTLEYYADTNTFVFDVDTDAGSYGRSLTDILIDDPADAGLENGQIAKIYGSNPTVGFSAGGNPIKFRDVWPLGLDDPTLGEIAAELKRLAESDIDADNEYYIEFKEAAQRLVNNGDQYYYGYTLSDGYGYYVATNMTSDDSETETVAIGEFSEFYDNDEELHGFFVYGHRTPLAEVPTTGSANYEGKISGAVLTNNSVRSLTGSAYMDVDFASGLLDFAISTLIREGSNNEGATTFLPYKDLEGQGTITDTVFSGDLFEVDGDAEGAFEGGFFGPVANEAGGTFRFGSDSAYASGAFTVAQPDDGN